MKLQNLKLKNFKLFRELQLDTNGNSVILFGINGTGKSTILSAINYLYFIFLRQLKVGQSKAFESFRDDMITSGQTELDITALIELDHEYFTLARHYWKKKKNERISRLTYSQSDYAEFRKIFKLKYLDEDHIGMPIFAYYSTARSVKRISGSVNRKTDFDKLSAIEHAIDNDLDFQTFFDWFLGKESDEILCIRDNHEYKDKSLQCVRDAIEKMIGGVSNLRIERDPMRMVVDKGGKEIQVDLLSDGEKSTLSLLGDLARRLILANPEAEDPLKGSGIVLIDEIELHMHPSWQRKILRVLKEVFPNIQFFITTHSPQVLGETDDSYTIFSLDIDEEGMGVIVPIQRMNGYDSNLILEDYMGTDSSSRKKKELVSKINSLIIMEQYNDAEMKLEELKNLSGEDDQEYILAYHFLLKSKRPQ